MDIMDIAIAKALAGGGGGGGGSSDFVINFTLGFEDNAPTVTADKTLNEIIIAIRNGDFVRGVLDTGVDGTMVPMSLMSYSDYEGQMRQIDFIGYDAYVEMVETLFSWQIHINNDPDFGVDWGISAYTNDRTPVFQ